MNKKTFILTLLISFICISFFVVKIVEAKINYESAKLIGKPDGGQGVWRIYDKEEEVVCYIAQGKIATMAISCLRTKIR